MGTRSLTLVYNDLTAKLPLVNMYRQYDGYPEGHGKELADFLNSFAEITNGISMGETRKTANGMGCLAAQLIANFKTEVGNIYLYEVDARDCWQDYEYHVYEDFVRVMSHGKQLFEGNWKEFAHFCVAEQEEV
jgi:hypothetical protein